MRKITIQMTAHELWLVLHAMEESTVNDTTARKIFGSQAPRVLALYGRLEDLYERAENARRSAPR